MDRTLEVAAVGSLGGFAKARGEHVSRLGQPCANCETVLQGPYCHACGQLAEGFERNVVSLLVEAFENLFHADGRLFRTLPALALRPARLTSDYISGRRAYQIPPLRLFLVVVVLFFLAGDLKDALSQRPARWDAVADESTAPAKTQPMRIDVSGRDARRGVHVDLSDMKQAGALGAWAGPRITYALNHPRELGMEIQAWLHRVAIAFLPVSALILGVLFVFQRRFVLYDHAIFSMHSLSFMGLLATAATLIGLIPLVGWLGGLLFWLVPVHLFVHMRGSYGSSVFGTLIRMALLGLASAIAFGMIMAGVVVLGVMNLRPS